MTTLRSRKAPSSASGQAVALAAGAWRELGVSGWTATHDKWAVDVEPLILFTAWLDTRDIRLLDEATDWCVRNWRFVSRTRLKNLARRQPSEVQEAFGVFAATVGAFSGVAWPGATDQRMFQVTGRSVLSPLERPSMAWVRLRSMFGLGARAEILRVFLSEPQSRLSVATLASATGFLKRTVADECESLELAGMLSVRSIRNRFVYALAKRAELEVLLGALPEVLPDWSAMFAVARELVLFEELEERPLTATLPVHARQTLDRIADDLDVLGVDGASADARGQALIAAVHAVGTKTLAHWATGKFPQR
ncbi:MAG TPA: hypothetical protein PK020_03755 [Ilumatobacteraceae bacterium]|nr:hypothetical protein [Ilumatobacteraceae bacterium]HRB03324.1 hypothetical protein [Ilumatobacteraceae bacterium]